MRRLCFLPILLFPLAGCSNGTIAYLNPETYTEYGEPVVFSSFSKLSVFYRDGDVFLKEGEEFRIEETNLRGDYHPLYYKMEEGTLAIQYCKSGTAESSLSWAEKKLEITIPSSLAEVALKMTSGNIDIASTSIANCEIRQTSGDAKINVARLGVLDIDATSGDQEIHSSSIELFKSNTTSGNTAIETEALRNLEVRKTSGNNDITVKDSKDLNYLSFSLTSGNSTLRFDGVRGYNLHFTTTSGNKNLAFEEGSDPRKTKFNIEYASTSGNLDILKHNGE